MFDDNLPLTRFKLTGSQPTTTGVIIARYQLTQASPSGAGAQPPQEAVAQR